VILAGHGVTISGAENALRAFAERGNIPVAQTLLGIGGLAASHPLNLGMMGMHGEAWVNIAIQSADLLIACGMRFDDRVTGNLKTYAPTARKIHVDIDRAELNKNVRVDVAIAKDLRAALVEWLPHVTRRDRVDWLARIDALKGDSAVRDIQQLPDDGHLYAAHAINDLWRLTEGNAIVVTDVGQHQMWEAQYYKHERPRSLITSGGLGTMGFGLPAAIGAQVARPDTPVLAMIGDGSFLQTGTELAAAAMLGLPLVVVVLNNGGWEAIKDLQINLFGPTRKATTNWTTPDGKPYYADITNFARSLGCTAERVEDPEKLADAVERAFATEGPVVLEVMSAHELPWTEMHPTGWWDITVPAYHGESRDEYVDKRGF
jgi:acetolactate synthase I/II/III large subunit